MTLPPGVAEASAAGARRRGARGVRRSSRRAGHRRDAARPSAATPATRAAWRVDATRRSAGEWRIALVVGALATVIAGAAFGDATGATTRITVLDVGQGDAILLETRTRRPDARRRRARSGPGPASPSTSGIPPGTAGSTSWCSPIRTRTTSPAWPGSSSATRVGRVYEPGMRGPGPGWAAWDAVLRDGPPHGVLATGARLRLGEVSMSGAVARSGDGPARAAGHRDRRSTTSRSCCSARRTGGGSC